MFTQACNPTYPSLQPYVTSRQLVAAVLSCAARLLRIDAIVPVRSRQTDGAQAAQPGLGVGRGAQSGRDGRSGGRRATPRHGRAESDAVSASSSGSASDGSDAD